MLAAGAAPRFLPAHVFGANGQTTPANKITVGVLGVGAQGTNILRNFLGQDEVRVTAICDVNRARLTPARNHLAEAYGSADVKLLTDFRELTSDPAIDAVAMVLPVHWHSIPTLHAIAHGKHVFHEKPMALSLEEGQRIRAAVKRKGVVFQFGTQQRSDQKFRWACELARNGRLGRLQRIEVCTPTGQPGPIYPPQPVPQHLDWDRWVGPAPATPFHVEKLKRDNHQEMTAFSLGRISCWGVHHLDIAQWGNGADATGPRRVRGTGVFPTGSDHDAIRRWRVDFEFENGVPIAFADESAEGFTHGVRFVGDSGWVHVRRGVITPSVESLLRDPQNKVGTMPVKLAISVDHTRDFLAAIRQNRRAICDVESSLRSDTLCQLALIATKRGHALHWDPRAERFTNDDSANALLRARPFRGEWKLPVI